MYESQDRKGYIKRLYETHLERLQNITPTIDNKEPKHLHFSKKWESEYNRKIDSINDANTKLVNRLINQKSSLDNKQNKQIKEVMDFKHKMIIHKRKTEMAKIVYENMILKKRIANIEQR
jgi:hypothetical protein